LQIFFTAIQHPDILSIVSCAMQRNILQILGVNDISINFHSINMISIGNHLSLDVCFGIFFDFFLLLHFFLCLYMDVCYVSLINESINRSLKTTISAFWRQRPELNEWSGIMRRYCMSVLLDVMLLKCTKSAIYHTCFHCHNAAACCSG